MPRIATKLKPATSGGFIARKRIPADVQDAYEKLYGQRWEERTLTPKEARALAGEWYGWFVARKAARKWTAELWEGYSHELRSELYGPAMAAGVFDGDPLDAFDRDS